MKLMSKSAIPFALYGKCRKQHFFKKRFTLLPVIHEFLKITQESTYSNEHDLLACTARFLDSGCVTISKIHRVASADAYTRNSSKSSRCPELSNAISLVCNAPSEFSRMAWPRNEYFASFWPKASVWIATISKKKRPALLQAFNDL